MTEKDGRKMPELDGGPAFPLAIPTNRFVACADGMSLRDYFAARFIAIVRIHGEADANEVARNCYIFADAMLKERAKS